MMEGRTQSTTAAIRTIAYEFTRLFPRENELATDKSDTCQQSIPVLLITNNFPGKIGRVHLCALQP